MTSKSSKWATRCGLSITQLLWNIIGSCNCLIFLVWMRKETTYCVTSFHLFIGLGNLQFFPLPPSFSASRSDRRGFYSATDVAIVNSSCISVGKQINSDQLTSWLGWTYLFLVMLKLKPSSQCKHRQNDLDIMFVLIFRECLQSQSFVLLKAIGHLGCGKKTEGRDESRVKLEEPPRKHF